MPSIVLRNVDVEFNVDAERDHTLKATVGGFLRRQRPVTRAIRALRSVSLKIAAGERLGVIGANGAGKSTLLKVLARIYPPCRGEAIIEGHVCPLFEFATGFEMDASGWDNIRTRAMLLGMSTSDIEERLEEIGCFTGLEEFLDFPVRCYSSGMLLRLAFAASTAVDPEILLLDEVMGAGDAAFIDQARSRMDDLIERASIVVFASHSLDLLSQLCSRTLWLHHGILTADGPTPEVIEKYLATVAAAGYTAVAG